MGIDMTTSNTIAVDVGVDETIAEILRGRADSYRMFSRLFLKPLSEEDIDVFASMNLIDRSVELGGEGLLADGFNDMGRGLRKRNTGTRQSLATDFTMCFDGIETVDELVAVPYASIFLGEEALFYQEPRHEIYRLFMTEGIKLSGTVRLPEDHISFELEFLAILSERILAAYSKGDLAEADRNLKLSREFIQNHILTWIDMLIERANKILKTRFYLGVLKAVRGYLELDLEVIAALLEGESDERIAD